MSGVWAWQPLYLLGAVGPWWELEIRYADRGMRSEGTDAYPGLGGKPVPYGELRRRDNPFTRFQ